ncbi:MAG: hypothetical protein M3P49_05355, partial [Actinomycetota bacterium]|nr:hypothetical protein [Actinomycetota bacterium]
MARAPETITRRDLRAGARRRPGSPVRKKHARVSRLVAMPILLCAILSALVAVDGLVSAGEIRGGVSVGDADLGGKTPEEARAILSRHASETLEE